LLRNGASASVATKEGDTPVELALRFGHGDAADVLRKARQSGELPQEEPAPQAAA